MFTFALYKLPGFRSICEAETILFEKTRKSLLKKITVDLENEKVDNNDFQGETITFTFLLSKIE